MQLKQRINLELFEQGGGIVLPLGVPKEKFRALMNEILLNEENSVTKIVVSNIQKLLQGQESSKFILPLEALQRLCDVVDYHMKTESDFVRGLVLGYTMHNIAVTTMQMLEKVSNAVTQDFLTQVLNQN